MRRRVTLSLLLGLLLSPLFASAQQAAPPTSSGVISGTLTSADLGRPVRKAQMKLVRLAPRSTTLTATDASGRFEFGKLEPGEYILSATKPGYLDAVYGAIRPGASMPGATLTVAAGQKIDNLAFRIPRGGVISGIVTDEFGDPAYSVLVRAMRYGYTEGGRMAQPVGQATTDDTGAYRIAGLMPGEYVVSAVPRDSVASAAASAESLRGRWNEMLAAARANGTEAVVRENLARATREQGRSPVAVPDPVGYVAVFHPASATPAGAARIRLGVGEQITAADIQLQVVRTAVVKGTVTNAAGRPVAARVQLLDPSMPIANLAVWFRTAAANGTFAFHGIPPGSYVARAQASAGRGEGELTAAAAVQVQEAGVHDVDLALRSGFTASGALDLSTLTGVDTRKLQVDLMVISTPADWESPLGNAVPDAEGKFVIRGLAPGRYRVGVRGLPDGWAIASAVFEDADAADFNLHIDDHSVAGGVIKFTNRTSNVDGTVTNSSGDAVTDHTVLLFASEREYWVPRSRRVRVAQPGADGRFSIKGLPPGTYRVAAVIPPEAGQEFDPEFLAQAVGGSREITVGPGERKTHDIKIR